MTVGKVGKPHYPAGANVATAAADVDDDNILSFARILLGCWVCFFVRFL